MFYVTSELLKFSCLFWMLDVIQWNISPPKTKLNELGIQLISFYFYDLYFLQSYISLWPGPI